MLSYYIKKSLNDLFILIIEIETILIAYGRSYDVTSYVSHHHFFVSGLICMFIYSHKRLMKKDNRKTETFINQTLFLFFFLLLLKKSNN
jgi:hypothetical protein